MQPQSPDPKFDFMLKDNPQPGRGLGLPAMGKPMKIGLFVLFGFILLIIITSLASHRGSGTKNVVTAVEREQEILRVTQLTQSQQTLRDPGTTALAATVNTTVASQQSQLLDYLAKYHTKVGKAQLAADMDKNTDAQLKDASQNNQLDEAYKNYLRQALTKYQSELQIAYKTVGPNGKALLKEAFDSNNVLLANPPLKLASQSNYVCNAQGATAC